MPISSIHIDTRPDWRGGQNQVLLTLSGLKKRGHAVELMALSGGALERRALDEGFLVHAIPASSVRWQGAWLLRKLLRDRRYQIVHAHDPHGLTLAWLARTHRRAVLIAQRRVANPLSRAPFALARYRDARQIFAVSKFIAKSVVRSGISANQIAVVYEGVKLPDLTTASERVAARAHWKIADTDLLLGCVGYLLPEKGQEVLIRALPSIQRDFPSCRVILAAMGANPSRPQEAGARFRCRARRDIHRIHRAHREHLSRSRSISLSIARRASRHLDARSNVLWSPGHRHSQRRRTRNGLVRKKWPARPIARSERLRHLR